MNNDWQKQTPKEPGFYWALVEDDNEPETTLAYFLLRSTEGVVITIGKDGTLQELPPTCSVIAWAGPLLPPPPPTK